MKWILNQPGMAFRVFFMKKNFDVQSEPPTITADDNRKGSEKSSPQMSVKTSVKMSVKILRIIKENPAVSTRKLAILPEK
jgi:hypothetical protein